MVEHTLQFQVPQVTLSGHNEGVSSALWLNDAEICTSSWDHTIKLWDMEQMAEKSSLVGSEKMTIDGCS
jgi:ribosome biogenesis protein YTM1